MKENRKRKPGGGRKPQGEFKNVSKNLTTRITAELRQKLQKEANKNGRSLSQEVERRLHDSLDKKGLEKIFSKTHIAAFSFLIGKLAADIETPSKTHWQKDRYTYLALKTAILTLMENMAQQGEIKPPQWVQDISKDKTMRDNPAMPNLALYFQNPEQYGVSVALGLIARLNTCEADVPGNDKIKKGEFYMDEFFQLPVIRANLERDD